MITEQPQPGKYQLLHDRGVLLQDEKIDWIVSKTEGGINLAFQEFGIRGLKVVFVSSDNGQDIGIVMDDNVDDSNQLTVNIPIPFFNSINTNTQGKNLSEIKITINSDVAPTEVTFSDYCESVGMEEAIHKLQNLRRIPSFIATIPDRDLYKSAQRIVQLLCDYEVEARINVDAIRVKFGKTSIWTKTEEF